ncbi:hypothetical protein WJ97_10975 [Burkholderia ubonensis]|uniref:S26 family signal peptidase n=1 Tax=Burkholderia ubonensis TaxID=101571 RepID=UPI00075EBAAD|nr:S26 family signal peptidase [Burkholderia ubonensis]KVP96405.1 hypothetical protein WJ97_10975 [Burkholderia ubonensis]
MTEHTNETAAPAVNSLPTDTPKKLSLKERFKDPTRWKKSLTDVGLWFMYGILITTMLNMYSPGYPIVVGTTSIKPGLYWLDRQVTTFYLNDYVTFPFKPAQDWLLKRYGDDRVFTKMVKGVPGDTIYADSEQRLKVCHTSPLGGEQSCQDIGVALKQDSIGRPMTAWVPANHQYTLRAGELWVYAPNVKSLDSRYYGPIRAESVHGKASPLVLWD